jgi:hypothetical protein
MDRPSHLIRDIQEHDAVDLSLDGFSGGSLTLWVGVYG